ncbi:hypothetical protein L2725_13890 [Shewanella corallii]|uniref:HhH-GPD domain-containing protein n=1 Tax=Shewanella corallii TaxID=560080 RepID=A0ABT0N9N9_9GAMM|nr:hypothetical protein [Shewanella corallii]MCL2914855.1 hypothetical protein [Shewanella corallii]
MMPPETIRNELCHRFPALAERLSRCPLIPIISPSQEALVTVLIRAVVGQMLSQQAAATIYGRVARHIELIGGPENLCHESLIQAGLSRSKARTVIGLRDKYLENEDYFEAWRCLPYGDFRAQALSCWGIGEWTVSVIAIFHLGHTHVFPHKDGTIIRVC